MQGIRHYTKLTLWFNNEMKMTEQASGLPMKRKNVTNKESARWLDHRALSL